MTTTTRTKTVFTLAASAAVLAAAGTALAVEAPAGPADRVVRQAEPYAGDPWEQRVRTQFWQTQHIHDSWNRCHLGENAPRPSGC